MRRCQSCSKHYEMSIKTTWSSHDILVSGKTVIVEGIEVLECACGLTPVLPDFDSFLEQIKEVAHPLQVWRRRAEAWVLVRSGPLPKEEPKVLRAVSAHHRSGDAPESDSEDTWRSLLPTP